jgi:RNA polymerase sigma-70 factor (ECF subfamily)
VSDTLRLLAEARDGSRTALDALYARHRGRLLAFVASRMAPSLRASVAPEDVVQETHLEAARKLDAFDPEGPASFYRWLVGIARNKVLEAARAQRAKKRAIQEPLAHDPHAAQTSPSGRVMRAERAVLLGSALDELPEAQAEAVRLRYLEGLSVAECAERMERSTSAVKSLVTRGLAALAAKARDLAATGFRRGPG